MDLKYLNTFRVIAEEGSFTRAAERLGYTQSTMTFQMGQLEQALSARLFEKVGRRMVLSQAGRQLLPYVERVLEAVNQMHCFTQDLTQCRGAQKEGTQAHRKENENDEIIREIWKDRQEAVFPYLISLRFSGRVTEQQGDAP